MNGLVKVYQFVGWDNITKTNIKRGWATEDAIIKTFRLTIIWENFKWVEPASLNGNGQYIEQ